MKPKSLGMAAAALVLVLGVAGVGIPAVAVADEASTWNIDTQTLVTQAGKNLDIGNGSVTCDQGGTLYTITGTSNKHTITVRGGTAEHPVMVDLAGVTMKFQGEKDGDSTEAAPLTVEDDAYAIIYIGKDSSSVVDTLTGGNEHGIGKNTGYAGICVKSGAHVTIAGQGTLNVTGGGVEYGAAAIGGNYNDDVKDLTIDGSMTINATGGYSAPGIGSGRDGELYSLVINSGTINATGGKYAPGIGAGDAVGTGGGGTMHAITINGGTITATGGYKAAGIGGSEGGSTGDITINGGTITASGGEEGAGIGGGSGGDVSSITITGGTVTATGGANGAGIGGGKGADSGVIVLEQEEGATFAVTATGGTNGAGIGSAGHDSNQIFVHLKGGTITATGGDSGAGIGAGNADAGLIDIQGAGTIWAKGGKQGCGIGAGENSTAEEIRVYGDSDSSGNPSLTINAEALTVVPTDETALKMGPAFYSNKSAAIGSGRTECGPIDIRYAVVNAAANGYGADIGGGNNHGWNPASVKSIYIEGCTVNSQDFGGNVPNDKVAPSIGAGADGNMGTIEIWSSTITGAGIGAASDNFDDCNAVDSVKIITSTVTAIRQVVDWDASTSASQAAGIGSGIKGDVGSIDIEDSTVTAQGVGGGAGIGSGGVSGARYLEGADPGTSDVGTITIERSNITATGSVQKVKDGLNSGGAGIGLGFAVKGSGTIHSILVEQCNVEAIGEWGAAGIGTSCGSNYTGGDDGDGNVTITDSGVTAKGGYGAAGIGAGMQYGAHGGDARIIKITGSSAITATGGEGAAGIGGGKDGGVDAVTIALESTGIPPASIQYVTAAGGLGAAGIGSGAGGHDVGSVTIQSGYVTATGGTDLDGKGTGAGIGGGNAKGALKNLSISGGFINANAGSSDAYDIGCGGTNGALSTDQNGTFTISGGTVLATNVGCAKTMIVTGGSVLANLTNAYDAAHNHVYRTTLTLPIGTNTQADVSSFVDGYGTTDIYSDANRKVYLYRTATDAFKASADVTMTLPYQGTYHYIGQTLADGTGLLKIQPQISFKDPEAAPAVGDTFKLNVEDSALPFPSRWGNCVYTVSGCASYVKNQSDGRHTGAYVGLKADGMGTYTVTATCAAPVESADVYWPATASYTGTVTRQAGAITITEDPSKVYDGQKTVDPSVNRTGDGEVTYTYYQTTSEGETQLAGAPSDAGSYRVEATMAGTDHYTTATDSKTFTIGQRPVVLELSAALSGDTATLTTTVTNMVDAAGQVDFTVTTQGGSSVTVRADVAKSGDSYIAQKAFPNVGAGTYTVVARYVAGWPTNYSCESTVTATFDKAKATRSITCADTFDKHYGDADFFLSPTASESTPGDTDTFAYEIVDDSFASLGLQPSMSVVSNNGYVSIVQAGTATIKITLTDAYGKYNEAVKYVTVKAARAPLTVTPYVKDSSGTQITEATYGSLDGLTYGLTFEGLRGEDTGDTFAGGHGKLEAVPLAPTAGVGDYTIGIRRVGNGSVTINGNTYNDVFVSRNYEITEVERVFEVKPATLTATASDATGTWGGTEPTYTTSLSGFVLGDTASSVFSTQPKASLDPAKTGGLPYSLLDPGMYASAIAPDSGTQNRNGEGYYNYDVNTVSGTLTVSKLDAELAISVDSKTYDGAAVTPKVTTNPAFDGTYTVTYYPLDSETALSGAPTDAGQYRAVATVKDAAHFADDTAACTFTISKATPDVTSPTLKTLAYAKGLTLAKDQPLPTGWTWDNPDTALSAGTVKANATYTPSDTANYNTVTRTLSFEVTEAEGSITSIADPSKTYDGTAVADPEVKSTNNAKVTYAWYVRTEPYATLLPSAPTDAGDYLVVATVADDGNHTSATDSRAFTIAKATPDVTPPTLTDLTYQDGMTLAVNQPLPDGWTWDAPTTALSAGTVRANATYTPADTANYDTVTRELTFTVSQAAGSVKITGDPSKTYDGTAVSDPAVEKSGTGAVTYVYYAGSDTTAAPLASAPKDAGGYTVVATVADDGNHTSATDSRAFTIAKATPDVTPPTLTDLTYRDGMTLAGLALPAGWTWDAPTTALSAGTVRANATYTPADTTNYDTVTRELTFTVTQVAGSISITGDPSKTYDGTAVADPAVSTEGTGAVTFAYYAGTGETAAPLVSAPKDAGSYTVVATVADDGNHKQASASRAFTISKATPTPDTPTLPSLVYRDGLTLADQALPAGWTWNEPTRAISVGTVSAYATYTPGDTANYTTVAQMLSFDVLEGQGTVSITEDVSKTYDGSSVETPAVSTTGDGAVTFSYYAGTDTTGTPLASAPVDAGTYTVVATLAETKSYKGASDSKSFEIRKAPIALGISATQSGTSATVTVTALGMVSADGSAKITVPDASGVAVTKVVPFAQTASGTFEATVTFDSVASGTYAVSAAYAAGTSNYTCDKDATATFDKGKATRTIDVTSSFAKTYGDKQFALGAKASVETSGDAFTYEVVQDSFEAYGFDPCVSVNDSGSVSVRNAGSCCVKITLTDSTGTYNDAIAYTKVTVARAALKVTSFATSGNTHVSEAAYGSLGSLDYGIGYEGFENGDTPEGFTNGHGVLEARGLDERSIVAADPYAIPIDQVASSGLTPAAPGSDLFLSRNYAITYQLGTLAVTPAQLVVSAADASGEWHGTEPGYGTTVAGLASWDSTDSAFTTKPTASLDTSKTGGKKYDQLEPGTYANVLSVTDAGTLRKNANGLENYTVTLIPAGSSEAGNLVVTPATPDVETPTLPDLTMRGGLTLADQALPEGWSWVDPTRALSVGHVEAEATYTPSDTTHYSSVTRVLSFEVVDGSAVPDDSTSSGTAAQTPLSHVTPAASATPATGDGAPAAGILAVAALAGAALVVAGVRRRATRR